MLPRPATETVVRELAPNPPPGKAIADGPEIALAAGARLPGEPQRRVWGGTSANIFGPDGN